MWLKTTVGMTIGIIIPYTLFTMYKEAQHEHHHRVGEFAEKSALGFVCGLLYRLRLFCRLPSHEGQAQGVPLGKLRL